MKDYLQKYPCRNVPENLANNILGLSDKNADGMLDFEEFYQLSRRHRWLFKKMVHKYCQLVVPHPHRTPRVEIGESNLVFMLNYFQLTFRMIYSLFKQIKRLCVRQCLGHYLLNQ